MTCYQRHLLPLFETLGLDYDKESRRAVDGAIRDLLAMPEDAKCPEIWAALKALPPEARDELPARLADFLSSGGNSASGR